MQKMSANSDLIVDTVIHFRPLLSLQTLQEGCVVQQEAVGLELRLLVEIKTVWAAVFGDQAGQQETI